MPRKTPKHPERVAELAQLKERRIAADRAKHGTQLAAMLDKEQPLPAGQSHFRDAMPPADDPLAPSPLQLRAERQIRAIDLAIDDLVEAHRFMTVPEVGLSLIMKPLQTLVIAGLIRRVIELSDRIEQPKQAAEIRHADRQEAREWVRQEWQKRSAEFKGPSHFGRSYVSKVKNKFGLVVSWSTIRNTWIKDDPPKSP